MISCTNDKMHYYLNSKYKEEMNLHSVNILWAGLLCLEEKHSLDRLIFSNDLINHSQQLHFCLLNRITRL